MFYHKSDFTEIINQIKPVVLKNFWHSRFFNLNIKNMLTTFFVNDIFSLINKVVMLQKKCVKVQMITVMWFEKSKFRGQ